LSDTRWEIRIDSVRPFRYQAGEIYDALYDVSQEMSYDSITRHEAELLASHIKSFKFLCSTVIWYNILKILYCQQSATEKRSRPISCRGDPDKYS
jgi:hypothetical protein